jgi:MFS family permease
MGFSFTNLAAVAEQTAATYEVALATVGVMAMAQSISHTAFQIPSGRLVDRVGGRRATLVGLGVLAVLNALATIAPDAWLAILCRTLMGAGSALAFVGGSDYLRGLGAVAQGWFGGAGLGGAGIAIAVMPALVEPLGWRAPWASAAILPLLAALLVAAGPTGAAAVRAAGPRATAPAAIRVALYRDAGLYRLAAMHMAGMGLSVVVGMWVVTLLSRAGGHGHQAAGLAGSLVLLLGVAARPLGGLVVRRRPDRVRHALAAGILGCAAGTLLLAAAEPYGVAVLGAALVGVCAGIPFAPAFAGAALRRREAPGTAVGLVNALGNAVVVVGAPLLGLAFSLPWDGRIGFLAVAGLWLLALRAIPSSADLGLVPAQPLGSGTQVTSATFSELPLGRRAE